MKRRHLKSSDKCSTDSEAEGAEHEVAPEYHERVQDHKTLTYNKKIKFYTVTVTYIQLSDEEARLKLAILEGLVKKSYQK